MYTACTLKSIMHFVTPHSAGVASFCGGPEPYASHSSHSHTVVWTEAQDDSTNSQIRQPATLLHDRF
eukprot:NODE_5939_length_380_cov_77.413897_g5226_i0.p1 GENE.NODE_5939_length_380_cov_77.413897_g5226_i0~~NODE_5939_length_380_cov_77.413897_g5226_i0.p1  ORF type:complete len:67 (+),score=4.94 NODE_5939_length_380_cov_77.413897_g5226_i0:168-368(+)